MLDFLNSSHLTKSFAFLILFSFLSHGWGGRTRTHEWRDQNPLPYHLATPQYYVIVNLGSPISLTRNTTSGVVSEKKVNFLFARLLQRANPRMAGPEPAALPLGESPVDKLIVPCSATLSQYAELD